MRPTVSSLRLVGRVDRHRCDDLSVRVVWIERQRVTTTHVQLHHLAGVDVLEHGDHVVVGEAQHAGTVHKHQHVP